MKYLPLLLLPLFALGCAKRSEFDVSAAQVKSHRRMGPPGLGGKLPPGAVKSERVYHKGDRLPDGSIADGERKVVTVKMGRGGPDGGPEGTFHLQRGPSETKGP